MFNKFRIWSSSQKRFLLDGEAVVDIHGNVYEVENRKLFGIMDDCLVQHYTGINDKNGTPIYSGDYLDFTVRGAAHGREEEKYESQEVYYDLECAAFMIGKNYSKTGDFYWGHSFMDEIDMKTIKVNGNIFQRKKL
jgi:hypothetical protein